MADEDHLRILKQGVDAWNRWRRRANVAFTLVDLRDADLTRHNLIDYDLTEVDLTGAYLIGADLRQAKLVGADLAGANLQGANLIEVQLTRANLIGANLCVADLSGADLVQVDLTRANLTSADLSMAHLNKTNLAGADLAEAVLWETTISNVGLTSCKNLETIHHLGPSLIDIRTLQLSSGLPIPFLRGVGLPEALIANLPSLLSQAIQHYSCFISYSTKDEDFVHRLHADLQDNGVRCWLAAEDMKIGAKILDTLDEAIGLHDKVLLVLSEASIASEWVEDEVTKAFEEERQRGVVVLFPVSVDEAVFATKEAWAAKLRAPNIGNFCNWEDHDAYQKALERVLHDLRVERT